jgi:hypothetical protein
MSNILGKLEKCQEGNPLKYAMLGDSVYMDDDRWRKRNVKCQRVSRVGVLRREEWK